MSEKIENELIEDKKAHKQMINELLKREGRKADERDYFLGFDSLSDLYRTILEYFDLKEPLLRKNDIKYLDEKYPSELKDEKVALVIHLLDDLKPILEFAYDLSESYEVLDAIKGGDIKANTVIGMIKNFLELNRSGRKKKFDTYFLEDFKQFREKNSEIFEFLKKDDNEKIPEKYDIDKQDLIRFLEKYRFYYKNKIDSAGRSTLYRYDKDMYFLRENIHKIEYIVEKMNRREKLEYGKRQYEQGVDDGVELKES
jgi:hypothetical protein